MLNHHASICRLPTRTGACIEQLLLATVPWFLLLLCNLKAAEDELLDDEPQPGD